MMNPYRLRRIDAGLTQRQLAEEAGVTEQVVLRTEQGLYTSPSPKLTAALVSKQAHNQPGELDPPSLALHPNDALLAHLGPSERLESEWHLWVLKQRQANGLTQPVINLNFYLSTLKPSTRPVAWHSIRTEVLKLSQVATAKLLVIQTSLLQDFEKTGHNRLTIETILVNWGIPTELINFSPTPTQSRRPYNYAGKPIPLNG